MPALRQALVWFCVFASFAGIAIAAWSVFGQEASGDYVSGMAQLALAILALIVSAYAAVFAVIAWKWESRAARLALVVILVLTALGYAVLWWFY